MNEGIPKVEKKEKKERRPESWRVLRHIALAGSMLFAAGAAEARTARGQEESLPQKENMEATSILPEATPYEIPATPLEAAGEATHHKIPEEDVQKILNELKFLGDAYATRERQPFFKEHELQERDDMHVAVITMQSDGRTYRAEFEVDDDTKESIEKAGWESILEQYSPESATLFSVDRNSNGSVIRFVPGPDGLEITTEFVKGSGPDGEGFEITGTEKTILAPQE